VHRALPLALVVLVALTASAAARAEPVAPAVRDTADSNLSGGRTALTVVRGGDVDGRMGSLSWAGAHAGWGYEDAATVRHVTWFALGGGPRGIEGGIGAAMSGGLRLPAASPHSAFVRAGIEGALFGNLLAYHSILELPQLHAGYQYLVRGTLFEVAAKGGWLLLGRHDVGEDGRRVLDGSPEAGALAALVTRSVVMRGAFARVFVTDDARPVDLFEASACGIAVPVAVCADVRVERGDVYGPTSALLPGARSTFVGLTVGVARDEDANRIRNAKKN